MNVPALRRIGRPAAVLALLVSGAFILLGLLIFGSLAHTQIPTPYYPSPTGSEPATVQSPSPGVFSDDSSPPASQPPVGPTYQTVPERRYRSSQDNQWDHSWQRNDEHRDEHSRH